MAARPQTDIDADEWEERQFTEMEKKGGAGAELVAAVRMARRGRTESGLDCDYTEDGDARYTIQQGLKAAAHGREDAAATLILQVKIIERMDRQRKLSWWILGILIVVAINVLGR